MKVLMFKVLYLHMTVSIDLLMLLCEILPNIMRLLQLIQYTVDVRWVTNQLGLQHSHSKENISLCTDRYSETDHKI